VKIVILTDAWFPQVNGVVRSLAETVEQLRGRGHEVEVLQPGLFRNWPCPTYPEIRLALGCGAAVRKKLHELAPDAIHISTEGPIGWAGRGWCRKQGKPFTTSFHTRFPDYVSVRSGIPADWIWPVMRSFHNAAERTFVVTRRLADELQSRGIPGTHLWPLGVDLAQFGPSGERHPAMLALPRPILLNVGRVAIEKNIEAFLDCPVPGSKVVVGDGPALKALKAKYPHAHFLGPMHGAELAAAFRSADVFVFPSRTDTFGLVNIEALASGLPVAAYAVPGPLDILGPDGRGLHGGSRRIGGIDAHLAVAIQRALTADRVAAACEARHYGWSACTDRFVAGLAHGLGRQAAGYRRPSAVATAFADVPVPLPRPN
jgi:glycosyltransferase involved in cell wall biosynthesis